MAAILYLKKVLEHLFRKRGSWVVAIGPREQLVRPLVFSGL
jgi:hypothetical protein